MNMNNKITLLGILTLAIIVSNNFQLINGFTKTAELEKALFENCMDQELQKQNHQNNETLTAFCNYEVDRFFIAAEEDAKTYEAYEEMFNSFSTNNNPEQQ